MAWLSGLVVEARPGHEWLGRVRRTQTHVSLRAETLTARDDNLFAHEVVETLERGWPAGGADEEAQGGSPGPSYFEWAMGVEVSLPEGEPPTLVSFGSNGRVAPTEPLSPELFAAPPSLLGAFRSSSPGLRLVVVTGACFARGWLPDGFEPHENEYRGRLPGLDALLVLRAATVGRPDHVSGWDMVGRRPKPIARLVPPGSVYFFERADGRPFNEEAANNLWLAPLGARNDEGFGRVVPGVWRPQRGE